MIWEMPSDQLMVLISLLASTCFICGWLSHNILGYAGFGIFGNWLLMTLGAISGIYAFNLYGHHVIREAGMALAIAFAGGLLLLVVMLSVKKVLLIR